MTTRARLRPIQLMSAAGSRQSPVVAPRGERTQIRLGDAAHKLRVRTIRNDLPGRRWFMTFARAEPSIQVTGSKISSHPLARGVTGSCTR